MSGEVEKYFRESQQPRPQMDSLEESIQALRLKKASGKMSVNDEYLLNIYEEQLTDLEKTNLLNMPVWHLTSVPMV